MLKVSRLVISSLKGDPIIVYFFQGIFPDYSQLRGPIKVQLFLHLKSLLSPPHRWYLSSPSWGACHWCSCLISPLQCELLESKHIQVLPQCFAYSNAPPNICWRHLWIIYKINWSQRALSLSDKLCYNWIITHLPRFCPLHSLILYMHYSSCIN